MRDHPPLIRNRLAPTAARLRLAEARATLLRRFPAAYAHFGTGSRIRHPILGLGNPAGISIGDHVVIQKYSIMETSIKGPKGQISIGNRSYLGYFCRITAVERVHIGSDVMIADRVHISDTGHNYEDIHLPISRQGLRCGRSVFIGDGAWIGTGAVVVGNLKIGEGAVVGANTVVHKDVAAHTVVSGNPARVIRYHDGAAWQPGPPVS